MKMKLFSSTANIGSKRKKPNIIDDIRESASGLPWASSSSGADNKVHVITKTSNTSSDTKDDEADFVAETAKQGVIAKAMETGLGVGEVGKKTLDNVWDATQTVKEAVAGDIDDEKKNI
ncbi:hypothetical protein QVD17_05426 [Tagetes erecta]|uniref:Uncharacterized protein n=1 Tax=Tagetes erecta TaxID=13708 RepID=A0AAD8PBG8_TARER|nr:hypothetical protein QVD17_05426 [Tagetes erecta]